MDTGDNHSKAHKPLIERRRRERINRSLDELKSLVLHSLNRDERDYSRMEKADILEMAVRFLRSVHQSEKIRQTSPKYTAGFNQCAANVMWYVNRSPDIAPDVRLQLLQRLALGLQRVHSNATYERPPEVCMGVRPGACRSSTESVLRASPQRPTDANDVPGPAYDVSDHVMRDEVRGQDKVCDLSMKKSPLNVEDGDSRTSWDRRSRFENRTVLAGNERYERYKDIYVCKDSITQPTQDELKPEHEGKSNSDPGQGQCFLNDNVWRPF